MTDTTSAGSRNCEWGGGAGGGHPDPEIREVPGLERIFLPLQASVWSKNKGAPPLDPPLTTPATVSIERMPADH